ncbi:hypothetical protein SLAV_03110 [Streptomyces lavendulae subsp. lavendulae]|uniref:DUF7824 domain-containing protein n=1 Tax=Streptomyces lavendulae subsp. lavendulae TaxID=58340 RepID=A0A2K8P9W0_STRLA|nr:DUF6493 family protein [Streptomyces lavendulae]ATZ22533.1 hypothetical protein SLAV_03110 [Streptomyces lavendulae subsp. lavendulae]QUQ52377.1 hypothetical protein SLLC_01145 [Streptomyces lavendulae subsp. lavendulae]
MNTTHDDLLAAVREGRTAELPALLGPLDRDRRKALLAGLKELRGELRAAGWARWQERDLMNPALLVAGAGCHTGAAAAAAWLGARDLRSWRQLPTDLLLDVLADRDPKWLGDLAHRLAARSATAEQDYALISALVRLAGCPMPTTDGCVEGWAAAVGASGTPLATALREDPYATALVPRLFETAEPVRALAGRCDPDHPHHWPAALAALAEDGHVDRAALLDGCTARLLRGGKPAQLKPYQAVLQGLRPTGAEEAERAADWIALTADAPSPVAGQAQQTLARLAAAGRLTPRLLAEMSAAALFRPEKKLVRAQLVLLGKELRRDPSAAPELLPVLGDAFGHPDTDIQERALNLAAAHLTDDPALRAALADQAPLLSPAHRGRAAELFGASATGAEDTEPYREILPPPPLPVPVAPAPETVAETVELVAALVNSRTVNLDEFERALDGLVRHSHRDRAALAEALGPALAGRWWLDPEDSRYYTTSVQLPGLEQVAAAVLGARPAREVHPPHVSRRSDCHHTGLRLAHHARLTEAARRITDRPLPFLLATPTAQTGSLDPEVLVARLAEYHRLGESPAPADFAQALLRVRRDPAAVPGAAALGTPEGDRLAAWLGGGGEGAPVTRRVAPAMGYRYTEEPERIVLDTGARPEVLRDFPNPFRELARPRDAGGRCWDSGDDLALIAVLPEDRETLSAWWLPALTACAVHGGRGGVAVLPRLAAAGGPAGPALHLVIAVGLGARHPEDRLTAVDALLTLAARGELDGVRLGTDLAELLGLGTVKSNRLADSLRTAAATGAHATTWAVLAAALPALLTGTGTGTGVGTGELLALAADCVEQSGAASPEPAGLAVAAAGTGRSRLVTQSARLHEALRRNRRAADARAVPRP